MQINAHALTCNCNPLDGASSNIEKRRRNTASEAREPPQTSTTIEPTHYLESPTGDCHPPRRPIDFCFEPWQLICLGLALLPTHHHTSTRVTQPQTITPQTSRGARGAHLPTRPLACSGYLSHCSYSCRCMRPMQRMIRGQFLIIPGSSTTLRRFEL